MIKCPFDQAGETPPDHATDIHLPPAGGLRHHDACVAHGRRREELPGIPLHGYRIATRFNPVEGDPLGNCCGRCSLTEAFGSPLG